MTPGQVHHIDSHLISLFKSQTHSQIACGKHSDNPFCDKTNEAPASSACIPVNAYSPNYPADPFSVEVGDWSGKYGLLKLPKNNKIWKTFSSFYEVMSKDVRGFSVVFHCNNGARAFCAPFIWTEKPVTGANFLNLRMHSLCFCDFLITSSHIRRIGE